MKGTIRITLLLLLPIVAFAAGASTGSLANRAVRIIAPEPHTLLDAATLGQEDAIFRMISAGEDPGRPVLLERPLLSWRRGDTTTPLLVAIANGELNQVAFMVRHTQRLTDSPNDSALCIAARFGHANIARFLMKIGVPAVPKNGCGELMRPEDVAARYGSGRLSKELEAYRLRVAKTRTDAS